MSSDLTLAERRKLLRMARAAELERSGPTRSAIEPADRGERLALSFAQARLWFLERLGGLGSAYHIRGRRRLQGALDREALGRALDRIVARHEALRTTFAVVGGEPEQRIGPADAGFHLVEHDLSGHPDPRGELERLARAEGTAPFSLEHGPLIRGRLVKMAADEHVLLLTMHHIVSDGWSTGIFYGELGVLYGAFSRGEADPLPPLPIQYADYAAWQRRWVDGDVLREQSEYWKRTLAGAPEVLELPMDHARPPEQDHAGAMAALVLDEALSAGLKALSARHGTTLFMTLLAGWATVLSRLSGVRDVVVGTPSANRGRREIEGLIGFFVNTLALRLDLDGAPTVAELLARVKARTLEAQNHQDIPFEQVVELVQPTRSLAHSPLFQVMFAWQSASGSGPALPGLALETAGGTSETLAKFDLLLTMSDRGGRLVGGVEYATSLFERATVERYLEYLRQVLAGMVADDRTTVDRLPLLPEAERAREVEEWNRTGAPFPADQSVPALFEARVRRAPEAVAVVHGARSLTYAELNARANRLAHALIARGAGADRPVAVLLPRSPELVVAELAVLKAGAAYVPLDATYPAERTAFMVADTGTRLVLSRAGEAVPELPGVERIDLDALPAGRDDDPALPLGGETVAYVMFTSGSTGEPKGVMVPHRAIAQLVLTNGHVDLRPEDRVAFAANPAFDATTMEVWGPLLSGGRIVVVDQDVFLDPQAYGRLLREEGVTTLLITPVLFNGYAEVIPEALAGVRHVLTGGDRALPDAYRRVQAAGGPVTVYNCYGPTETTCFSIAHPVGPGDMAGGSRTVPIGRPKSNARALVLDEAGSPVPVGVIGELYLGGAGLAHGYWRRPAMSAERFVPDPFAAEPGARLYRTGDLARRLADGRLEFMGRNDHQVKVRGYRIELSEIESRLCDHEAVRETVVVAREDEPGIKRLVAYWVGDAAEPDALRAHVGARLPEYMVPSAYVRLEALPLSPNGKVDRRALPAPDDAAVGGGGYEAPVGRAETELAGIWAEVLGLERVGRGDNFFELGGHSLLAVTLIERMRQRGLHGDVRALYTKPTLAELAAEVGGEEAEAGEVAVPANAIPPHAGAITPEMLPLVSLDEAAIERIVAGVPGGAANVQDVYPLAPLQEGILFHHLLARDRDPYVVRRLTAVDTRGRVDAYLAALRAVVRRHDILRTAVAWEGLPEPVQVVWREAPLVVEEVELDAAAGDAAEQLYARFDPRRYRIDVRRAPLLRVAVAHDAAHERWLVLLLQHHLAGDHTTLEVLHAEIEAHQAGRLDSMPAPLPFRNYVAQARLAVHRDEHERFFGEMLRDVREPTAPFGLLDVQGDGSRVVQSRRMMDDALAARIRAQARRCGVSAASLCHLAWGQVLARASGRADVVFGTLLFGRMQGGEGADRVMGLFVNTLPIRVRVGGEGAEAALRRTHELLAELLRHEHASLVLAQRCSGVEAPAPLFTSLLNYRHSRGGKPRAGGAPAGRAGTRTLRAEERTNYPLVFSVDDLGEGFGLTAQAAAPVDAAAVVALMHAALERLVGALETAPGTPLDRLDVLPAEERRRVVDGWNRTAAAYAPASVHALVAAQAALAPEAPAVVQGDRTLTYGELDRRANRLARHLRGLGVGPEARVALLSERSPELLVGMLAVLKAGGAYLPLDPAYPDERLRWLLDDAAPAAVLAQGALAARAASLAAAPVVALDGEPAWAAESDAAPEVPEASPEQLAYVIYTSGSTGRPKGVAVTHRGLANLVGWHRAAFRLEAHDRSSSVAGLGFDAAAWEAWPVLAAGATLALAPAGSDAGEVLEWWMEEALDVSFLPTPLAEAAFARGLRKPRLRTLLVGGDRLHAVPEGLGSLAVVNNYGPTETTVVATSGEVAGAGRPDVGRPVANARAYVLDGAGAPVPVGVAGELYVGGAGVARGYLGRPALTAERFVPDALSGEAGARLYRTGDRVRWLAEGRLDFLGRTDFQVKVRGFRIEPGEVEARLRAHPAVREAAVVARTEADGSARLVAYHVSDGVDAEALRAHLAAGLPAYMVPGALVRLDALPMTPNGKVDRAALPAPEGAADGAGYEPPVGETERALAGLWAGALGVERVGRHDNFFALGGHSLTAVQVVARAGRLLEACPTVSDLFAHPTVASLAAHLEGGAEAPAAGAVPVRAAGTGRPLFLVHEGSGSVAYAQLLAPHLDPDVPVYALPAVSAGEAPLRTVEGMAARLVRMVREVQPEGPYRLAGWSFGGVLAYEMAAQLAGHDQTVELVGLIDSYCPADGGGTAPAASAGSAHAMLLHMLRMDAGAESAEPDAGARELAAADLPLAAFVAECHRRGLLPAHVTVEHAERMQARLRGHARGLAGYRPHPVPVPVHLFAAADDLRAGSAERRGWDAVVPGGLLTVTPVPGAHLSLMAPRHVAALGRALSDALLGAEKRNPEPGDAVSPLVTLQRGEPGGAPTFCIPGAGANAAGFVELVRWMDPAWPVYGLQPRGLDGMGVPHQSVETAAEHYLRAIAEASPDGPVHLLGHSFGGLVAFEMAQRLHAAGRTVESLTILDTDLPDEDELCIREFDGREAFLEFVRILELSAGTPFDIAPSEADLADEDGRLKLLHQKMVGHGMMSVRSSHAALRGPFRTFATCLRTGYRPSGAYPEPLRLVLVRDDRLDERANRERFESIVEGWRRWAPGTLAEWGAGNHVTALMPPHVAALAACMAAGRGSGAGAAR